MAVVVSILLGDVLRDLSLVYGDCDGVYVDAPVAISMCAAYGGGATSTSDVYVGGGNAVLAEARGNRCAVESEIWESVVFLGPDFDRDFLGL